MRVLAGELALSPCIQAESFEKQRVCSTRVFQSQQPNRTEMGKSTVPSCRGSHDAFAFQCNGSVIGGNSVGRADAPPSAAGQCGALTLPIPPRTEPYPSSPDWIYDLAVKELSRGKREGNGRISPNSQP